MLEFRRTFQKPEELPKFDFERDSRGHQSGRDGKSVEQNLNKSSGNDDVSTDGKPTYRETRTHDTTIHTTVKPPVVHETIRPIETEIIGSELTVHRHVHHYVHRIQPVIVSSFEEERLAHDILGQGQPALGNAMYRDTIDAKGISHNENSNEMCQLCGAEGNLLSHIGSLKRRNNEASTTGACPVCGSDRGFGRSADAELTKDTGAMRRDELQGKSGEKEVNEGLGGMNEFSDNRRERDLAREFGENTEGISRSRGVETSRGGFSVPEARDTRTFDTSQGAAGTGESTEGLSGSRVGEPSGSESSASEVQHTRGFNASQGAAAGSEGELSRGIRNMDISK